MRINAVSDFFDNNGCPLELVYNKCLNYSVDADLFSFTGVFCNFFLDGEGFFGYIRVAVRLTKPHAEMIRKSPKYPNSCLISLLKAATIRLLMMSEEKRNA